VRRERPSTETALKIKETSYLQAEGMPTETMLHGPFQCVEAYDLFVLVVPSGAARERTLEVAELVEEVGAPYVIFGDDTTETRPTAAGVLRVPEVPEPFSALSCLVPLQLLPTILRSRAGPTLIASGETTRASRGPTSRGVCR
jgi:glutamine---fructose-6-phosphate transaminase (isomerizing)